MQITNGGSNFAVFAKNTYVIVNCAVKDFFNGSYQIYCPRYTGCLHINVRHRYSDFQAYNPDMKKWYDTPVFEGDVCFENSATNYTYTGWQRLSTKSSYSWHNNEAAIPWYNQTAIQRCLNDNVQRLMIIGNSHMRITFQYMMHALGIINNANMNLVINRTFHKRYAFYQILYATTISEFIRDQNANKWPFFNGTACSNETCEHQYYNNSINNTKMKTNMNENLNSERIVAENSQRNVFILGFGSHDMKMYGVEYFCEVAVEEVKQALVSIKNTMGDHIKLMVVTQPPIGEKFNYATGKRNNAAIGATNAALIRALSDVDVTVIDGYNMQIARFKETADDLHYTWPNTVNSGPKRTAINFRGEVGVNVIQMVINTLCNNDFGSSQIIT